MLIFLFITVSIVTVRRTTRPVLYSRGKTSSNISHGGRSYYRVTRPCTIQFLGTIPGPSHSDAGIYHSQLDREVFISADVLPSYESGEKWFLRKV